MGKWGLFRPGMVPGGGEIPLAQGLGGAEGWAAPQREEDGEGVFGRALKPWTYQLRWDVQTLSFRGPGVDRVKCPHLPLS